MRRALGAIGWALGAALACMLGAGAAVAGTEILYLQPVVDGRAVDGVLRVVVGPDGMRVADADLARLGLVAGTGADGGGGTRLFAASGAVSIRVDMARQVADISVPGADILPQSQWVPRRGAGPAGSAAAEANIGGDATYDLAATRVVSGPGGGGGGQAAAVVAGRVDFVLFGPDGTLLAQTGLDVPAAKYGGVPAVSRLGTTYEFDDERGPAALRLGDVTTISPGWAREDLAAGVQWATDDALQPIRVTFPTPMVGGTLADPSAVSLLVNNARAYDTNLSAGPFSLVGVPVLTGLNEITVQTRDADGRISATTVPFYASATMLQPGLAKFSVTAGYLRQNYGTTRDGYRVAALDGSYSVGLSDAVTATVHAEDSAAVQLLGGALETANWFGDWTLAVAGSRHEAPDGDGAGALVSLQFSRAARLLSLGAGVTYAGPGYADLAAQNGSFFPRLNWYASASAGLPWRLGSVHVAYTTEQFGAPVFAARYGVTAGGDNGFLLASYSANLWRGWSANLSLSLGHYGTGGRSSVSRGISATLSVPLGGDRRGQVSFDDDNAQSPEYGQEISALPTQAVGWGAAAQNAMGDYTARDLVAQANTLAGDFFGQVSQFEGQSNAQLQARGSLAVLDGVYVSAPINPGDGFAVFDLGYPHIPVLLDNRADGVTDAQGRAFLPGLLPYYPNRISVSPTSLPLTASFKSNGVVVVPPLYGGMVARLPVSRVTGVLIRLDLPGGGHPPVGAVLRAAGLPPVAVGYDGEALLEVAPTRLEGVVEDPKGRCAVAADLSVSLENYLVAVPVSCAPLH